MENLNFVFVDAYLLVLFLTDTKIKNAGRSEKVGGLEPVGKQLAKD